jgi:hypothetical protein
MLIASRAATVGPILLLMSVIVSGCTESIFSDGEPVVRTAPPEPRNPCEETFAWLLTNDLGTAEEPPPTPTADVLATVLNDCTAEDLLEADDYFAYDAGQTMQRLTTRRLFNGPERAEQLVAFCESSMWSETRACETLPEQGL